MRTDSLRALTLALAVGWSPLVLADEVKEIEVQWQAIEEYLKTGDLANLNLALDLIEAELSRRIQLGFLKPRGSYVQKTGKRVNKLRRWLEPQLPAYGKLTGLSDSLAKESWNLGLFQGGLSKFELYADLLHRLEEAEKLAGPFLRAYPRADESQPVKKLAAARKNLDTERTRAVASWLAQANDRFDTDTAQNQHVSSDVAIQVLKIRAVDPKNSDITELIAKLDKHREAQQEQLARKVEALRFPLKNLPEFASSTDEFKALFYANEPMSQVKRIAVRRPAGQWVDAATREAQETVPAYFGVKHSDGSCEVDRVWFWRRRKPGDKRFRKYQLTGIQKLYPILCEHLAPP